MTVLAAAAEGGLRFGLLVSSFFFGFRHGIDWDHIAAITDITSSQEERKRALFFGTLYVVGHAAVVLVLGIVAILLGDYIPEGVDRVMGRIVGVTLVLLAVYVVYSLIRHGQDFRMRSRWMLVFTGVRKGMRWARDRAGRGEPESLEPVVAEAMAGEPDEALEPADWHHGHHGRRGHHHHVRPEEAEEVQNYSRLTAVLVGMIHGVGAETPTQIVIFLTAAQGGGTLTGILVLVAFIVGLVLSNSVITIGSALGFLGASRNFAIYAAVALLTAGFSFVIGVLFLIEKESALPSFFGG